MGGPTTSASASLHRAGTTSDHAVVIVGGGPTGLMLAGELALAGVDVVVVERRTSQHVDGSRAGGLHARTLEVLDQRGISERFVAAGQPHPALGYGQIVLDVTDFPTRHPYVLALWQSEFEPILLDWVEELGVPILRGREVVALAQDAEGVDLALSDGSTVRARYVVGCDGGRSTVRRSAGIGFTGLDASTSWMIAEVEMDEEPELGFRRDRAGTHVLGRRREGEPVRVVITEPDAVAGREPTMNDLRTSLVGIWGTDFGLRSASWISRFDDAVRQADGYRRGRVLVAGDAAHVHPPHGGQGLNVGVQDAVNLGWKLAQVVDGRSPEHLLDTYHAERHPVAARVLHNTMAQVALAGGDERHQALRETMTQLLSMDEPRRHVAGMISGLDVRYDLGGEHALVGRRMPDLDLRTEGGARRMSTLLHSARGVLLDLDEPSDVDLSPWTDRVDHVRAAHDGDWELPVLGPVPAPSAVLVRPDGYVAWVGHVAEPELPRALATWFGAPGPGDRPGTSG